MRTSTSYGPVTEAYKCFALVNDVTNSRATVVMTGTAAEVWDAYHEHDDECLQIVGVVEAPKPGERIFHSGAFVSPDDMLLRLPLT